MNTEQELRRDLQQRLVEALYGPGVRRSDSIEELADALIAVAVAAARRSSDEQAEVVGHIDGDSGQWVGPFMRCKCGGNVLVLKGKFWCCAKCGVSYGEHAKPPPAVAAGGVTAETIDFVMQYGGDCRDCADEFGTCPHNSLSCDVTSARKAIGFVLRAVEYGQRNGYLTASLAVGDEGIREGQDGQA